MSSRSVVLHFGLVSAISLTAATPTPHRVRASGTIEAIHSVIVQVPRVEGLGGQLTLAKLIPNGTVVHQGDLLAEFDRTNEVKLLREAEVKYDDLKHKVDQKVAEHQNNKEKRNSDLQSALADRRKAELEIRKGPILSDIDQQKNQVKLDDAREHVESLERSNRAHDAAEAAERRVLELQRDRQKLVVDRQHSNAEKLSLRAAISGMVALQNIWRNNSMGHAEEGDQLNGGSPLLRLFDPSEMEIELSVGEPDGAILVPGAKAVVHMDAFPGVVFSAHFDSASPVATASLGSSVKTFTARFRVDGHDPHLLPDLSAALDIEAPR